MEDCKGSQSKWTKTWFLETELDANFTVNFNVFGVKSMVHEENLSPDTEFLDGKRGMGSWNQHGDRRAEGEAKISAVVGWNCCYLDRKSSFWFTPAKKGLAGSWESCRYMILQVKKKTRNIWRDSEGEFGSRI